MNVVKVEKNAPFLESGQSAVETAAHRLQPNEETSGAAMLYWSTLKTHSNPCAFMIAES